MDMFIKETYKNVGTPGTRLGNSFESSSQIMLGPNTVVPPLNSPFGTGNSHGGSL